MIEFFKKMQTRSIAERQRFALLSSLTLTALIVFAWLPFEVQSMSGKIGDKGEASVAAANAPSPFASLKADIGRIWNGGGSSTTPGLSTAIDEISKQMRPPGSATTSSSSDILGGESPPSDDASSLPGQALPVHAGNSSSTAPGEQFSPTSYPY